MIGPYAAQPLAQPLVGARAADHLGELALPLEEALQLLAPNKNKFWASWVSLLAGEELETVEDIQGLTPDLLDTLKSTSVFSISTSPAGGEVAGPRGRANPSGVAAANCACWISPC